MPLRDHFRPPVSRKISWREIHGGWPMVIVQQLKTLLPPGFVSAPSVQLGPYFGIDVAAYEQDDSPTGLPAHHGTATWTAVEPSLAVETEIPEDDEYEVRIYDAERDRTLVAVIELVSPANKDRPDKRNAFVGKCAALLRSGVSVSIVDAVTVRQFNLYAELMEFIGHSDTKLGAEPPATYAASCRWVIGERRARLETWTHTLTAGQPLPTLPLWLTPTLVIPLNLEQSYEKACDDLSVV